MTQPAASPPDPHELQRFVNAQRDTFDEALAELRVGRKHGHWMWFVFPQVAGLGRSAIGARYAIASREEAVAYLAHPVLGPRLRACAEAVLGVAGRSAHDIFGYPDDLKLRSSMTLFAHLAEPDSPFRRVLDRYFEGAEDPATTAVLAAWEAAG
jgi:uncharacterized protein (DUF1810 family)